VADGPFDAAAEAEDRLESNAAATALALDGARDRPELSGVIADFLREQKKLIAEQREQMHDQDKRTRLGIVDQRFSIALKAITALVGITLAAGIALMVWNASGSGGLVIEPFSVPPDLAARGLTGPVLASKLLDRLAAMQAQTDSQRDPKTYTNYWGDDIKVEIPSTGISIGELDRFLREKLGHPTHITGEVVRDGSTLALTARAGIEGSSTVAGVDGQIDALVQRLAESLYGITEPYRYGAWLREHNRNAEGMAVFVALRDHGPPSERPWGWLGWANAIEDSDGVYARLREMQEMFRRWPDQYLAGQNVAINLDKLSRPEAAIATLRTVEPLLSLPGHGGIRPDAVPIVKERVQSFIALNLGDFQTAQRMWRDQVEFGPQGATYNVHAMLARAELGMHDISAARATIANVSAESAGVNPRAGEFDAIWGHMLVAMAEEDWQAVVHEHQTEIASFLTRSPARHSLAQAMEVPLVAYSMARLGRFTNAEKLIAETPADCYVCLLYRARIRELEGRRSDADYWFARAVTWQPSIPFAYAQWGEALLARGKTDAAIANFRQAQTKGPHFADPLEMWGEALIRQNRSDLALAKFAEADKYAPNWGRLHLKWGDALLWSGDKAEAKKQFEIASHLDLSASDKTALVRISEI
jgi:tetratricopeptide (TPR) repeat protein